jgi:glycosyltransferase involved in cell wall biosynthesis
VTTEPFRDYISSRGARGPIELMPNGTTRRWLEVGRAEPEREGAELPADRFVWTYAGNLGIAQGLETAVEAAAILGDGFQLQMVGAGAARGQLERAAAEPGAGDVVFRGPVEIDRAAQIMRASDALLVSLADRAALDRCVPGKLYNSGAVRRPVVVSAAGETKKQSEAAGAALTVTPGDAQGLAHAVRSLRDDPELSGRLIEGGERLAAANLREDALERLSALLTTVVAEGR